MVTRSSYESLTDVWPASRIIIIIIIIIIKTATAKILIQMMTKIIYVLDGHIRIC